MMPTDDDAKIQKKIKYLKSKIEVSELTIKYTSEDLVGMRTKLVELEKLLIK